MCIDIELNYLTTNCFQADLLTHSVDESGRIFLQNHFLLISDFHHDRTEHILTVLMIVVTAFRFPFFFILHK